MKCFEQINKKRRKCILFFSIGIPTGLIGFLLFMGELDFGVIFVIIGIVLVIVGAVYYSQVIHDFKNVYLRELIEEVVPQSHYNPKGGIPSRQVYDCKFIKRADRYTTQDYIKGDIDNVQFETCDIKLEERRVRRTKNGTQTYYVTFFQGRFFEFDFPKEFKGHVIVTEWALPTLFSNMKKIQLESIDFNKKFRTYTNNEHNAFYILTPHLMESIMQLERNHPGSIGLSFTGNRLNIAINNRRNTFKINMFKEFNEASVLDFKKDLLIIKEIVDELKLNRNIFVT